MAAFLTHLKELKTTSLVLVGTSIKNVMLTYGEKIEEEDLAESFADLLKAKWID